MIRRRKNCFFKYLYFFLKIAENCHTYGELVANQELFQFLASLGLLSLPGVGK